MAKKVKTSQNTAGQSIQQQSSKEDLINPGIISVESTNFVVDEMNVDEDPVLIQEALKDSKNAKDSQRQYKKALEMGYDLQFDPIKQQIKKDVYGRKLNPWTDHTQRIIQLLEQLPTYGESSNIKVLKNIQRALKGLDALGRPIVRKEIIELPGNPSVERNLLQYVYNQLSKPVIIPLGDLKGLTRTQQDKLKTYASLISNRVSTVSELNYFNADVMADIVMSFKGDISELDVQTIASERTALVAQLKAMTQEARRKYIVNNILQPLMRTALVDQLEVDNLPMVDITEAAHQYAEWEKILSHKEFKDNLMTTVASTVASAKWSHLLFNLQVSTINGVPHNAVFALHTLENVFGTEDAEKLFSYSSDEDCSEISMESPLGVITRRSMIKNVNDEPVVLHDSVNIESENFCDVSRDVIIAVVMEIAKLKNLHIADAVDIDLITRYPAWSGLINQSAAFDASGTTARNVIADKFGNLLYTNMLVNVLSGITTDNPVASVFLDATRDTVEINYSGPLSMFALARKTYMDTLTSILYCIENSWQWKNDPIWEELKRINIVGSMTEEGFSWQYNRRYDNANNLLLLAPGTISATAYYFDDSLVFMDPRVGTLKRIIQAAAGGGVMETKVLGVKRFTSTSLSDVDALVHIDQLPWYLDHLLEKSELVRIAEIPTDHPMFNKKVSIKALNVKVQDGEPVYDHAVALLTNVEPAITIEFQNLDSEHSLPIQFIDTSDDQLDERLRGLELFGSRTGLDDNSELLHLRLVDPVLYVDVKRLNEFNTEFDHRIFIPRSNQELVNRLTTHAHNVDLKPVKPEPIEPKDKDPEETPPIED